MLSVVMFVTPYVPLNTMYERRDGDEDSFLPSASAEVLDGLWSGVDEVHLAIEIARGRKMKMDY